MNITDLMDTPRVCTALAEWGACIVYIILLQRKRGWGKLVMSLTGSLACFCAYHFIADALPLYLWIPAMAGAIILMGASIRFFCEVPWKYAGFCCVHAFVLAELAASLHWQLYVWFVLQTGRKSPVALTIIMTLVYLLVFVLYYFFVRNHVGRDEKTDVTSKELFGTSMIAAAAFAISNLSFVFPDTPFSSASSSILYVRTLLDFGGLLMLVAQMERLEELRMKNENQIMNIMLQRQYDQYRMSIDNVELLRREFHDLKHYMLAIRSEENPEKKDQYLSEMEQAIQTQEAMIDTGNHVLDVVLTTKNTYCTQNHITFTCMADGDLISFMHVKDICSIFGNALDNAIECVSQFEDREKRLINLSMFRKNRFLMIQFENYTETPITLNPGKLPGTTKSDKQYHGYGLKSIRAAAQKYGGTMNLQTENNWFTLQVLIQLTP